MSEDRAREWFAKLEITEQVMRLARGIDRCDRSLIEAAFWPDATDDHGIFTGTAKDFTDWVIPLLQTMVRTQHAICNVLVELAGDKAFSEAYFIAYHRQIENGDHRDMFAAGRYLDRFERRGEAWRIIHRQTVYDWTINQPATDQGWTSKPMVELIERGLRGPEDRSYRDREAFLGRR